ncbi:MAG: pyridoxamine 5'-phosphate oxidase family protein [Rhodospirillales bacterium]|nr:pyridoxamine 5'-phosphate oxidase family protein [Alphaproteobacteria bacterium]MBL6947546.1 pyridoxamine 5'-phosphate oxidase family protein [Rhodospirillales bacterium]
MAKIATLDELRQIYKPARGRPVDKQLGHIDPHGKRFIELSPFLVIASSGPGGRADASPRGEEPGFVHVLDAHTLAIPDRPGNNRLDTMENILKSPEVGLIFLIPGVNETYRVNGWAEIRDDDDLRERFEVHAKRPAAVIVVQVRETFLHCAKALMRSHLWEHEARHTDRPIPTMGEMIREQTNNPEPPESTEEMIRRYKKVLY